MKSATVPEIKKVLNSLEQEEIIELCLRLVKYKKDNKELLNYLLFEASDEKLFVSKVKIEMDELFSDLPRSNTYLIKKGLRKILKITTKYIKHANSKVIEVDLLLYFCLKLKQQAYSSSVQLLLATIWEGQLKKIGKGIATFHEDLQYDYHREMEAFFSR